MLKVLRSDRVRKKIFWFLAVIIVISFGISGVVLNQEKENPTSSLGKIQGRNITVQDYLGSYRAIGHQAQLIYGDAYAQIRSYINFKGEAWDRLILLDYAKREGIKTSDKEIVEWIAKQPSFGGKNGFDPRVYELVLKRYLQTEPRPFEEEIREMLTISKIQEKLESRVSVTDDELKTLYGRQFGDRSIRYAVFSSETQVPKVNISEDEIKKIYPLYESRLAKPARCKIRYVLVPTDASDKQKAALQETSSGMDDLASRFELKIMESGYFSANGTIEGIGLEPKLLEKSFSLEPKAVSEWIDTKKGSYKIEVLDKQASFTPTYEEAHEQLKAILIRQKSIELTVEETKVIAEQAKKEGFDKTLEAHQAKILSFDAFKPGAYLPDIGPAESLTHAIGSLNPGESSDAIAIPGGATIVQVVKDAPLDEKKFEEGKDAFKKKILQERSTKEMENLLETLRKELVPNLELMKQIFPEEEMEKSNQ